MSSDDRSLAIGALQQTMSRKIDPEQLQLMGKQAAALYSKTGKPLSETVVEVAKHASLSPEQVKRVCEFANTSAYLEAFEKSGEMRNVTFEHGPADPSVVLKELNDGSVPAVHQMRHDDYDRPPRNYKTASVTSSALAEAFLLPQKGLEKMASAQTQDHCARISPVDELYDVYRRMEDLRDQSQSKLASCDVLLDGCTTDLQHAVQQELICGTPEAHLASAWATVASPFMVKQAMRALNLSLPKERGKVKTAGKIPNPAHPVVDKFLAFTKIAEQKMKLAHLVDIYNEQLEDVAANLRSALNGLRDN